MTVRLTCVVLMLLAGAIFFMVWATYPNAASAAVPVVLGLGLILAFLERLAKWAHSR